LQILPQTVKHRFRQDDTTRLAERAAGLGGLLQTTELITRRQGFRTGVAQALHNSNTDTLT